MKSASQPATNDEDLMLELVGRLDRLQAQLDDLNDVLRRHVERVRRRRKSGKARLASFSHQAKKLADHAPS
jgi:hypothetical protein